MAMKRRTRKTPSPSQLSPCVNVVADERIAGMTLQTQARLILYLLGGGIVALLLALVLGAISVSGVISMTAVNVFLWIAISILGISLVAIAVIYCPTLPGPKAAFLMLLLVAVASAGWYGRARLSSWLLKKKAEQ